MCMEARIISSRHYPEFALGKSLEHLGEGWSLEHSRRKDIMYKCRCGDHVFLLWMHINTCVGSYHQKLSICNVCPSGQLHLRRVWHLFLILRYLYSLYFQFCIHPVVQKSSMCPLACCESLTQHLHCDIKPLRNISGEYPETLKSAESLSFSVRSV